MPNPGQPKPTPQQRDVLKKLHRLPPLQRNRLLKIERLRRNLRP